jgi:hypothetical protein
MIRSGVVRLLVLVSSLVVATVLQASGAEKVPYVSDIRGAVHSGEAHVHFQIRNGFSPEMVEALKSGIEISFKTVARIENVRHGWFNKTIGEAEIVRSVRFDALSRVYRLNRGGREELVNDVFGALAGMTEYDVTVPLTGDPGDRRSCRVLIRTRLDRVSLTEPLRSILFFSSLWDIETEWARGYLAVQ